MASLHWVSLVGPAVGAVAVDFIERRYYYGLLGYRSLREHWFRLCFLWNRNDLEMTKKKKPSRRTERLVPDKLLPAGHGLCIRRLERLMMTSKERV